VSLTTLTFATVLAGVKPGAASGAAARQEPNGDESGRGSQSVSPHLINAPNENDMAAAYTFDVFSSLDGYGAASGNWTGYWGKQGPELVDHRLALYDAEQRMVFGANTYRAFVRMLASSTEESEVRDPWVTRMRSLPATVVSTTLEGPLDWPNATLVSGDAVDVVARLKEESGAPLRSHGSLSMHRALMAAGLVDRVQVTLRRPHPRADLPAHPACLSPAMHPTPSAEPDPEVPADRDADRSQGRPVARLADHLLIRRVVRRTGRSRTSLLARSRATRFGVGRAPSGLGGLDGFEGHPDAGGAGTEVPGDPGAEPDVGEGRRDRVGCPDRSRLVLCAKFGQARNDVPAVAARQVAASRRQTLPLSRRYDAALPRTR
jgi:dihydrofolate reductase